jgi:hypothetical protein
MRVCYAKRFLFFPPNIRNMSTMILTVGRGGPLAPHQARAFQPGSLLLSPFADIDDIRFDAIACMERLRIILPNDNGHGLFFEWGNVARYFRQCHSGWRGDPSQIHY